MTYMFNKCSSLSFLPDISKWNTNHANHINFLFKGFPSLLKISGVSKWIRNNQNDVSYIISECINILN